ncbi:YdcF family protein [Candidatus Peregrinibacteria bacterium]|nr:YdcF family protein [Candidatus Peregrinibacteria bacterium]
MTHLEKTDQDFFKLHNLILQEQPVKNDVIVWLQGDRLDRGPKVVALYRDGWEKKVIITGNNVLVGKGPRPGEQNITIREMQVWLEQQSIPREDIIIEDESMNTKDQAVDVLKIDTGNGMSKLLLVGSSFYQPRAFLTFLKEARR